MIIRAATIADARSLFDWRNDPLTRSMSVASEELHWDDHVSWLEGRLSRERPDLYIAEVGGQPVGTFRLDGEEISYTIAPEHRGKRYAKQMLILVREQFGVFLARMKRENGSSYYAAADSGHRVQFLDPEPDFDDVQRLLGLK